MSDGFGCTCAAYGECECCCGVDWTPKEVYELRQQLAKREKQIKLYEQALLASWPEGAIGKAFDFWNAARILRDQGLDGPVPNLKPADDCGIRYVE